MKHSTAYHPQTDGQSEVVNRGLEQYLRVFTQAKLTLWFDYLGWAEFSYNTSFHTSIQMSPFKALYGREPPVIPAYTGSSTSIQALDELLLERDALLTALKTNLRAAQHRMQQKANAHRRELELQVGDQVLVKLQPYRQISVANKLSNKLAKRYYGPFRVTERIGAVPIAWIYLLTLRFIQSFTSHFLNRFMVRMPHKFIHYLASLTITSLCLFPLLFVLNVKCWFMASHNPKF